MRSLALMVLLGGVLTADAAPAPLPRPVNVESVVVVPKQYEAQSLATTLRSGWFLASALQNGLPPGTQKPSSDWVKARLRVSSEDGGGSLRLTLVNCEDEGLDLMRAIVAEYLCEVIPERKAERKRLKGQHKEWMEKAQKAGRELTPRQIHLIHTYFLDLVEQQKAARIVTQEPRAVWGRR
jgi:hypothetical protein